MFCHRLFSAGVREWCLGGRVDWEGIVVEDVLDGSNLCVVAVFLQVVFSLL